MSEVRRLFDEACNQPVDRQEDVLKASGASPDVIARVVALLHADRDAVTRMARPLAGLAEQLVATELKVGDTVGVWRLLREIGVGGMGSVFLAERADGHFRQQAAIKLIRGRADRAAAKRFARERQTLANLRHPQIARLLDGGATPEGQPYLVMEHVEGQPVDRWCQQRNADLSARLALFVSICRTVQFAHQQLVVHCDIKPSNVLVRDDGVPILLDFGIAQAVRQEQALSGQVVPGDVPDTLASMPASMSDATTLATTSLEKPMTPRYASPEQLRGQTPSVTSDVYSLGLLLYELVAGQPPERAEETSTPKPSATAATVPWRHRLRGDLDAIVARACAVDPASRYPTAEALSDDVARIAAHEPVLARRHDWLYVLSRFLRRRWAVLAVTTAVVVLSAGFTWRTLQAERRARVEAETAQRTTDFLVSVFSASDSGVNSQRSIATLTAREVLDAGRRRIDSELADQPHVKARLLETMANAYRHMNQGNVAVPLLREAVELNLSAAVNDNVAAARCLEAMTNAMANGEFAAADTEAVAWRSLDLAREIAEPDSQPLANAWMVLSLALNRNGKYTEAEQAARTSLAMNEKLPLPDNRLTPAHHNLAMILSNRGDLDQAMKHFEQAMIDTPLGSVSESMRMRVLSGIKRRGGDFVGAITALNRALEIVRTANGEGDSFSIVYRRLIAQVLVDAGRFREAEPVFDRALADQRALTGESSDEYLAVRHDIAASRITIGESALVVEELKDIRALRQQRYGDDDPRTMSVTLDWVEARIIACDASADIPVLLADVAARWQARNEMDAGMALQARLLQVRWLLGRGDTRAALDELDGLARSMDKLPAASKPTVFALRAWALRLRRDSPEAIEAAERAFAEHQRWLGDAHPRTAMSALILARTLRNHGEAGRAATLETAWRPVFERGFPADSQYLRVLPEA